VRVATGRAGKPDPSAPAATTASAPMSAAPEATAAGVLLQVAAFGSRSNAERALAALQGAGIAGARLHDGAAAGKPVWRLRVGPVARAVVAELRARVAGLGFDPPQPVRE